MGTRHLPTFLNPPYILEAVKVVVFQNNTKCFLMPSLFGDLAKEEFSMLLEKRKKNVSNGNIQLFKVVQSRSDLLAR